MLIIPFISSFFLSIFFVKDFSGTTALRILKFGANVGHDLYCVRESASSCLSFPLLVHISFSPIKISVAEFSAPMRAKVSKCRGQVYCGKENQDAVINLCILFPFFHLSLPCNT